MEVKGPQRQFKFNNGSEGASIRDIIQINESEGTSIRDIIQINGSGSKGASIRDIIQIWIKHFCSLCLFQFICDQKALHAVKKHLEENGHEILSSRHAYLPNNFVTISEKEMELIDELIGKLSEFESTVRVYSNARVEGES